jgi:hypothetical protein
MMPDTDALERSLRQLPMIAPDPARADRLRARCLAELTARHRRAERAARRWDAAGRVLGPALVGGLCAIYLVAVIGNALRIHGVL